MISKSFDIIQQLLYYRDSFLISKSASNLADTTSKFGISLNAD